MKHILITLSAPKIISFVRMNFNFVVLIAVFLHFLIFLFVFIAIFGSNNYTDSFLEKVLKIITRRRAICCREKKGKGINMRRIYFMYWRLVSHTLLNVLFCCGLILRNVNYSNFFINWDSFHNISFGLHKKMVQNMIHPLRYFLTSFYQLKKTFLYLYVKP